MYRFLFFDLDGTLTDSHEGITKSVSYALVCLGYNEPDLNDLFGFIGPPLLDSFQKYYGMEESEAKEAIRLYRERYSVTGKYENYPYEGIPELLENLKKQNDKLSLNVQTLQENIQQIDIKLQGQTNLNLKARDRIAELKNNNQQLNEQLLQQEEGLDQIETYRNKLAESIKECSSYKKRAQELQEAYAQVVSKQYGVDFNEIQDKLSDTKSAEEIRNLCESIQSKNLRMKSLPFEQGKSIQKITYNNSKPLSESKKVLTDSDVDADLERLFEIYNHR